MSIATARPNSPTPRANLSQSRDEPGLPCTKTTASSRSGEPNSRRGERTPSIMTDAWLMSSIRHSRDSLDRRVWFGLRCAEIDDIISGTASVWCANVTAPDDPPVLVTSVLPGEMSQLGQEQTWGLSRAISVIPPKADIQIRSEPVGPKRRRSCDVVLVV